MIRRLGMDPALIPGTLDNRLLNQLDRNRRLVDAEDAGCLARSRADAAGELRKVVGRVQTANGIAPTVVVDQIVPVRIRLLTGQPVWQKGTPQSMQRAPCSRCFSSGNGS